MIYIPISPVSFYIDSPSLFLIYFPLRYARATFSVCLSQVHGCIHGIIYLVLRTRVRSILSCMFVCVFASCTFPLNTAAVGIVARSGSRLIQGNSDISPSYSCREKRNNKNGHCGTNERTSQDHILFIDWFRKHIL